MTGATGFVGAALAERMVEQGWRVRGLARRSSSPETVGWLRSRGVEIVEGDVERPLSLPALVRGADAVIHCAAVIGYRRRLSGAMQRVNVMGTGHVVDACLRAGVGRLVHVSSIAAIGLSHDPSVLLDEDSPFNAGRLGAGYFTTKHEAEGRVAAGVAAGLDAVIVNPGGIYGAAAASGNTSKVVSAVARGRVFAVPVGGMNAVTLATVLDGTLAALERGATGRRYVLGGENLTYLHLIRKIGRAAGREVDPLLLPASLGPLVRAAMTAVEPVVPDRVWWTPELAAAFGGWMWFDTGRMRRELLVEPEPVDGALAAAVAQLAASGRLGRGGGARRRQ